MSDLVENPEDRFSRVEAHMYYCSFQCIENVGERYEILSLKGKLRFISSPQDIIQN